MGKKLEQADFLNPYIIAEIGVNHGGSLDLAKKLIELAAKAGADAAKFQAYKADKIASKDNAPYYWDLKEEPSESQHALFSKYDKFGEPEYKELKKHCEKNKIDFLSTPFDLESVDMLDPLVPFHKIASADITNIPLLRRIASKKKVVLLSTGASTDSEIEKALVLLKNGGAAEIILLHCVLNYPTPKENAQLAMLPGLKSKIKGYSDHVAPESDGSMPALEAAVLSGAVVLEKHFTHDRKLKGNDHYHAMDENGLKNFMDKLAVYRKLYGSGTRNLKLEKMAIKNARRKIIAAKDIKKDEIIDENSIIALRSDKGIDVSEWDDTTGKKSARDINKGEPLTKDDII